MTDDQQAPLHAEEEKVEVNNGDNPSVEPQKQDPRDAVTPDHPRFKEVLSELKEEREARKDLEAQIQELRSTVQSQNEDQEDSFTEDEERALDKILIGLRKKGGIVSKDDLAEVNRIQERANLQKELQREYNGNNGYPKFDVVEVTEHAKKNGFGDNLKAAYKDLHYNAIVKVEAKKLNTPVEEVESERPSGGSRKIAGEYTPEDIANMSDEEWAKNGDSIYAKFKRSVVGK